MPQYIGLAIIGALGYLILWREGLFRGEQGNRAVFVSAGLLLAAMALRGLCLGHETLDYQNFLTHWVTFYRDNGGVRALGVSVGNYNVPYLYFLALFSYSRVRDLYLIKLLSVLFDVVLAWGMLRLVRRFRRGTAPGLLAFFLPLFLPTVVLNGAYWGQCDCIYTAFGVWSLALALEGKPVRSVIAIALSFAFKLQAVFLMPVFLVLLFARRIKWYHLAAFPVTYFVVVLPTILAGRPVLDTVLLYFDQAGTVGSGLNYNSSSAYAFFQNPAHPEELAKLGIAAAFLFLLLLYGLLWRRRERLDDRALLVCAALIVTAVPFLLPHMHDRYFFPADLLTLAAALALPRLAHVPVCVSFASLLGYHAYLRMRYLLPMRWGAVALLAAIVSLCAALALALRTPRRSTLNS